MGMAKKESWLKVLIVTNAISIIFLAIIAFHYDVPQKVLIRIGIIQKNDSMLHSSYSIRNGLFSVYKDSDYKIVMLGDSITAGVEWNELLGIEKIANRGIGGDTTEGFITRLPDVYKLSPEECFIMGGINDISRGKTVEEIIENYQFIIDDIKEHDIKPVIQSTLLVSGRKNWMKTNEKVNTLNTWLENYCKENGLLFVDINQVLEKDGALDKQYTYDGVHLLGTGYKKWAELLLPIIENE
jgi:lysophospholipase L1-like esterase